MARLEAKGVLGLRVNDWQEFRKSSQPNKPTGYYPEFRHTSFT
ncbi:hypothetical protein [Spirosoma endbachense]|nr:hypothetical protein [Spirosoma endbachense]